MKLTIYSTVITPTRLRQFLYHYTLDGWSAACSRRLLVTRIFNAGRNPRLTTFRLIIVQLSCRKSFVVTTNYLQRYYHFGCVRCYRVSFCQLKLVLSRSGRSIHLLTFCGRAKSGECRKRSTWSHCSAIRFC